MGEVTQLKVPPHSIEAEQSLLGGLMLDEQAWFKVADKVAAEDFYRPGHRIVFDAMTELANANQPLDVITLSETLANRALLEKAGGNGYLAELVDGTLGASNVGAYAEIVQERATLRRLIGAANEIADAAFAPEGRNSAEVLDHAEQLIFEIGEGEVKDTVPKRIHVLTDTVAEKLDALKAGHAITGVPSGFDDLDRRTAGFQASDLVIVAARPSMGKTALLVNMAEHAVMAAEGDGDAVLIFSMEQPSDQLVHAPALLPRAHRPDADAHRPAAGRRLGPLQQRPAPRSRTSRSTSTTPRRSRRTICGRAPGAWRGRRAA